MNEKKLENGTRMNDDVHQLRGIKLTWLKRDPGYFLGDLKVAPAHLEECFDADTLFYDIFFEPTNRYLVAVGPPLGNLQLAIQIYVNGEPVKLKVIRKAARWKHLVRGKVSRIAERNDILVKANGHRWQLSVPENDSGTGHKFTLCAIQKDNREHWIKDWIEHYRKIGVDRVILYDNNSEKSPDVDAIVIPCSYNKYGLSKYFGTYGRQAMLACFLHTSLLTICCYKYRSGHLLSFDVDELLQVKNLEKYRGRKLVYFDSCFVETKTDGKLPRDYSFRHFVYRAKRRRKEAPKYIARMDTMLCSRSQHRVKLKGNFTPRRLIIKIKRIWSYLKFILSKKLTSPMAPQGEDTAYRYREVYMGEDVYYHYKGINTGWKEDRLTFDEATEVVKIKDLHL